MGCASGAGSGDTAGRALPAVALPIPLDSVAALGPMVGHTTDTSSWIWIQPRGPMELDARAVGPDGAVVEAEMDASGGSPALLGLDGLRPDTRYTVGLEANDRPVRMDPEIAFRTFPRPGDPTRLRIALVSCARVYWDSTQTIWGAIAADRPDVVLWLGDNNYFEDGDSITPADWSDPERMEFKYAELRAQDLRIALDHQEITEMRRWCKAQDPGSEDAEAAIMRLAERPEADAEGLWEMIEIVLTIDGKVTKGEKAAAAELAGYIGQAFGWKPL